MQGKDRRLAVVFLEQIRELLSECCDLGNIADLDVGVVRILDGVVLVVVLAGVEGVQGDDLGDDGAWEDMCGIELANVGCGDFLLLIVGIENCRTIAGANVSALAVELRRIMHDGKEDAQQRSVGDLCWVEDDLDGLGVAGAFRTHCPVVGGFSRPAGVANGSLQYALDALKDGLDAPETTTGKDGGMGFACLPAGFGGNDVMDRSGNRFACRHRD